MKISLRKVAVSLTIGLGISAAWAAEPTGYYDACKNKCGANLLTALCNKISGHTNVGYDGLWAVYETSDVRDDGTVWDMYSTKHWQVGKQHCGTYSQVGDCINREHSFPKSWFNNASPMVADGYHVYPTDGKVNGQRSNFPYGECANGTTLASNGGVDALGKLGTCTFPGYSGKVFEPDDEYKGDFARSYFYMAACYNDKIKNWNSDMLAGNSYPAFADWTVNLLLKWHRNDPVSKKETDRNEAVYAYQHNRNPFIDHPELAEHIWGDKKNVNWTGEDVSEPVIIAPVANSTVDLGVTAINRNVSKTVTVKGAALKTNVTVTIYGTGFTVNTTSLNQTAVCGDGAALTISYQSSTAGSATGQVKLTSGTASVTFNVTANAMDGIPVGTPLNVSDHSFVATWVNISGASDKYTFTLWQNDEVVSGYPKQVKAADERLLVEDLEAATTYQYQLSSGSLTSQKVQVTTGDPIPYIQFLYDGDLNFVTEPGEPSEVAEILLDVENVDEDITISVTTPFQLSTDKENWSTSIKVSPDEERFYMRVFSMTPGVFTTDLTAKVGDYENDVTVSAKVGGSNFEDFEQDPAGFGNYGGGEFQGTAFRWMLTNAGIYAGNSEPYHSEVQSIRFGKASNPAGIEMLDDATGGIGTVTYWVRKWKEDAGSTLTVEYSTDQGATWTAAGSHTFSKESEWEQGEAVVNATGNVRIRITRPAEGGRLNLDDVEFNHYSGVQQVTDKYDYHQWDAYCRAGQLVIESDCKAEYKVYNLGGNKAFSGKVQGTRALTLPAGLYLVVRDNFTRKVLVK